jgi:hypothetical protein
MHREKQLTTSLTLMKELFTIVGAFDRSDDEERRKIGFESEHDILEWIRHTMKPRVRRRRSSTSPTTSSGTGSPTYRRR